MTAMLAHPGPDQETARPLPPRNKRRPGHRWLGCLVLVLAGLGDLGAQDGLAEILNLERDDPVFLQVMADVNSYYQSQRNPGLAPPLVLVTYTLKAKDTIYTISARLNLPYSSLASLNDLENPSLLSPGDKILIPNQGGLHIHVQPQNQMSEMLWQRLKAAGNAFEYTNPLNHQPMRFLTGEDFTAEERLAFLGRMFRSPLKVWRISSGFGFRNNPFSGERVHHDGLDMVAPPGSPIMASRDGIVESTGFDGVYGNCIWLAHSGGYQTMYAHLASIKVKKGARVKAGDIIGTLGNTGLSTGPHLHFQIERYGSPVNPLEYLKTGTNK